MDDVPFCPFWDGVNRHFSPDVISGALRGGSGSEQDPAVLAKHFRPPGDITLLQLLNLGVTDTREAAKKRGAKLGDQLLKRVTLDSVALFACKPVEAAGMSSPVSVMPSSA
ncbi:MAG TPA: hypothetical protein PLX89_04875 [Verrucomicrobiota bacterium]|nr:hypothetical protein [Verrucomicrobiota bacterium]